MAYRCLFLDDEVYTAQDVNDAFSNIAANGVSGYPFGANALSGLNTAIAGLAAQGVSYMGTSCLVVKVGGTYKISQGAAIMYDGTQIIFDSDGYVITPEEGVQQYVYLERDLLNNAINIVVSEDAGGANTVPLAEISETGEVSDRRQFATANVSIAAEPHNISINKRIYKEQVGRGSYFDIDLGYNGWKFAIGTANENTYVFEIPDGEEVSGFFIRSDINPGHDIKARRIGSILRITNRGSYVMDFDIEVEFR